MDEVEKHRMMLSKLRGVDRQRYKALLYGAEYGNRGARRALDLIMTTDMHEIKERKQKVLENHKKKMDREVMFPEKLLDCDYNKDRPNKKLLLL